MITCLIAYTIMGRRTSLPDLLRMMLEKKGPQESEYEKYSAVTVTVPPVAYASVWYVPMIARETSLLR
jgi:hypothetical protein